MLGNEERDLVTGVYRSSDTIHKLKLKVYLRHVKAAHIPLPQFGKEERDQDVISSASAATGSVSASGASDARSRNVGVDGEEKIFSWQEKVFSPFEVEFYSNLGNCHTPLEEQYHREIKRVKSQRNQRDKIFSYVQCDDTSVLDRAEDNIVVGDSSYPSHLLKILQRVGQKQHQGSQRTPRKDHRPLHLQVAERGINTNNRILQGFPQAKCKKMYIVADLSGDNNIGTSEYVLCLLRWDATTGTLLVTPDFSGPPSSSHPYRIEVAGDARNVYEYWLEHLSGDVISSDVLHQAEVKSKIYSHHAEMKHTLVGDTFSSPKLGTLALYLFGQITTLKSFDNYDLFVHYFIDLPKGWSCDNPEQLSGVTASCRALNGLVHLGHPLEMALNLNLDQLEKPSESIPRWPQLMLEVLSLDWWGRYRTEGYGYVALPYVAGSHTLSIHTWRPIDGTTTSELRRFFIGGNPELDDTCYVGVPPNHEGSLLGKYGLETVPSGDLHLQMNVVHQSSITSLLKPNVPVPSALLERLSATNLVNSVNEVLAAFRQAHQRMLAAKQLLVI